MMCSDKSKKIKNKRRKTYKTHFQLLYSQSVDLIIICCIFRSQQLTVGGEDNNNNKNSIFLIWDRKWGKHVL